MRETIQLELNDLISIDSGPIIAESIIEIGKTYFGYSIQKNYQSNDNDKNTTYRVSLIGFIIRKKQPSENTLSIVDGASTLIVNKLKELNFKCSLEDVTLSDDNYKIKVTAYAIFNEINNQFVI